jgi:hypothetical protein
MGATIDAAHTVHYSSDHLLTAVYINSSPQKSSISQGHSTPLLIMAITYKIILVEECLFHRI